MGLISGYADDTATGDNDRYLTYADDGTTKLTPASRLKTYLGFTAASGGISDNGTLLSTIRGETTGNFVASGGIIALSSGLTGTFSNIVYYISGVRYTKISVANKTYTALKDTYVDIDSGGTVTYTEVVNGAASPVLASNNIRLAKVVTSGVAITSITQATLDSLGNVFYPTAIGTRTVDSNGWKSYSHGAYREYKKRVTFTNVSILTGPTSLPISSNVLPTGMTTLNTNFLVYSYTASGSAGALVVVFEGTTGSTFLNFTASSADASRSYTGTIDITITDN